MNKALKTLLAILCLSWFATAAQAYTTTTNYSFQLPQVNNPIDQNQWGTELNTNFSNLDALLLTASNDVATAITTNTVLTNANQNQLINVNAASGAVKVTLQPAATAGSGFKVSIKKTDSTGNTVTVQANASELIDLANTQAVTGQNATITIICDGTQWWIVPYVPQVSVPTASTSVAGIVQLSSTTDTQTGTNSATAVTPASLASLATASSSGKVIIGPVEMQWGNFSPSAGSGSVTFGTAFSGAPYSIQVTNSYPGATGQTCSVYTLASTSFAWTCQSNIVTEYWFAVGPK